MAFDVDEYRAAHLPWSITVGGRTYVGRHVSAPAIIASQARSHAGAKHERLQVRELRHLLRLAFPWRLSFAIYGDPVRLIMNLEPAARREAMTDFFAHLDGRTPTTAQPTKMNGTHSHGLTLTRSA